MSLEPIDSHAVLAYLRGLQERIVNRLAALDGQNFRIDDWQRPPGENLGGAGRTAVLEGGDLFERAGVALSHVTGRRLPASASTHRQELAGRAFEAMGVSLVLHPRCPYVPTVHMNVRMLVARATHAVDIWWFGGGMDLTPYYGFEDDARHFHRTCRAALAPFEDHGGTALHERFKRACDEYFYLKHRQEARGIGGIFFDDFNELGFQRCFALMQSVGDSFLPAYEPIVHERHHLPYGQRERDFQAIRRGRYVEFNLILDRGTLFGLQSGGRAESILMSMPPQVAWRYDWQPAPASPEARLSRDFLPPRDWLA